MPGRRNRQVPLYRVVAKAYYALAYVDSRSVHYDKVAQWGNVRFPDEEDLDVSYWRGETRRALPTDHNELEHLRFTHVYVKRKIEQIYDPEQGTLVEEAWLHQGNRNFPLNWAHLARRQAHRGPQLTTSSNRQSTRGRRRNRLTGLASTAHKSANGRPGSQRNVQ